MTTAPPALDTDAALRQSLARGSLGIALLHVERARQGTGSWQTAHQQLASIGPLLDGNETGLFLGAPAMAYVLHWTTADSNRYTSACRPSTASSPPTSDADWQQHTPASTAASQPPLPSTTSCAA